MALIVSSLDRLFYVDINSFKKRNTNGLRAHILTALGYIPFFFNQPQPEFWKKPRGKGG